MENENGQEIVGEGLDLKEQIKNLNQDAEASQVSVFENPIAATSGEIKYAGLWVRFVAIVIDSLVLFIPNLVLTFFLANEKNILTFLGILLTWIYFVWMTNKYRATIGKKAMGLEVRSDTQEDLTLNQIILRETIGKMATYSIISFGSYISFILSYTPIVGFYSPVIMVAFLSIYFMAGFTKKKQALYDMIAKTVVVYRNS